MKTKTATKAPKASDPIRHDDLKNALLDADQEDALLREKLGDAKVDSLTTEEYDAACEALNPAPAPKAAKAPKATKAPRKAAAPKAAKAAKPAPVAAPAIAEPVVPAAAPTSPEPAAKPMTKREASKPPYFEKLLATSRWDSQANVLHLKAIFEKTGAAEDGANYADLLARRQLRKGKATSV